MSLRSKELRITRRGHVVCVCCSEGNRSGTLTFCFPLLTVLARSNADQVAQVTYPIGRGTWGHRRLPLTETCCQIKVYCHMQQISSSEQWNSYDLAGNIYTVFPCTCCTCCSLEYDSEYVRCLFLSLLMPLQTGERGQVSGFIKGTVR